MMPNGLLKMFVVPIESFSIPDWDKWKPRILSHLKGGSTLASISSAGQASWDDMQSDFFDNNKNKTLPDYYYVVKEALQPVLDEFQQDYPLPLQVINMWYQVTFGGQMHGIHNHGPVGVSAVMYVDFDPTVHKPTTFYSPFPDYINGEVMEFTPEVKEGDIVFFPSFVHHCQDPNQSEAQRVVISMNFAGKGQGRLAEPEPMKIQRSVL